MQWNFSNEDTSKDIIQGHHIDKQDSFLLLLFRYTNQDSFCLPNGLLDDFHCVFQYKLWELKNSRLALPQDSFQCLNLQMCVRIVNMK